MNQAAALHEEAMELRALLAQTRPPILPSPLSSPMLLRGKPKTLGLRVEGLSEERLSRRRGRRPSPPRSPLLSNARAR